MVTRAETAQPEDPAAEEEAPLQIYTVQAVFRTDNPDHLELILGGLGAAIPTMTSYGVNIDLKVV